MVLDDVKRLLLSYEGGDPVMLEIRAQGSVYRMEWSSIQVDACDELTVRLRDTLGASGDARLEPLSG